MIICGTNYRSDSMRFIIHWPWSSFRMNTIADARKVKKKSKMRKNLTKAKEKFARNQSSSVLRSDLYSVRFPEIKLESSKILENILFGKYINLNPLPPLSLSSPRLWVLRVINWLNVTIDHSNFYSSKFFKETKAKTVFLPSKIKKWKKKINRSQHEVPFSKFWSSLHSLLISLFKMMTIPIHYYALIDFLN